MKKYVCFITICLFILFSFSIFANEGIEDSLSFSDSVYQTIENSNKDNTIKIFNGTFMHLFGQRKGIEEIISDENLLEPYYAVKGRFSSAEYYYIREGASCKISIHPPELDSTLSYVLNPSLILNKVSPFLSAQHIYYLNGDASHDGIYIYYQTEKGDYVYYQEFASDAEGYLFPVDDFYAIAEEVETTFQAEKQEREHLDSIQKYLFGGPTLLSDIVDISEYQITPGNPVLLYVGLAAAVGIVGVGVFLLVRRKRARRASR